MIDALLDEIGVGGKPDRCAKEPQEVKFAEAGGVGQFGEGNVFGEAGIKIFEGGFNGPVAAFSCGGAGFPVRVAGYHMRQDG